MLKRKVLLVGEGNFSYSACFIEDGVFDVTATCLDSKQTFSTITSKNMEFIESKGGKVYTDVDATCLEIHPNIRNHIFDMIIFNFPHRKGKMKICENRKLLKKFFASATKLLSDAGEIHVALCRGQSGTPADNIHRDWFNTWQIVENATSSNLVLKHVVPFQASHYNSYRCTGYRGLEKRFNVEGAMTFIFCYCQPITVLQYNLQLPLSNILYTMKKQFIVVLDETKRSIHANPDHPIAKTVTVINREIETTFKDVVQLEERDLLYCDTHHENVILCNEETLSHVLSNNHIVLRNHIHHHIVSSESYNHKSTIVFPTWLPVLNSKNIDWKYIVVIISQCKLKLIQGVVKILQNMYETSQVHVTDQIFDADVPITIDNKSLCTRLHSSGKSDATNIVVKLKTGNNCGYRIFEDFTFHVQKSAIHVPDQICGTITSFTSDLGTFFYIALDAITLTSLKYHIHDERALYNEKSYFTTLDVNRCLVVYRPLSLYAPSYTHDVSFWVPNNFLELSLRLFIRCFAYNIVLSMELIDDYFDVNTLRHSLCYKFTYCGLDAPLCREKIRDIHVNFMRKALTVLFDLDLR